MDDPAIFRTVFVEGGFDRDRILDLIETQEIKQELIRNLNDRWSTELSAPRPSMFEIRFSSARIAYPGSRKRSTKLRSQAVKPKAGLYSDPAEELV